MSLAAAAIAPSLARRSPASTAGCSAISSLTSDTLAPYHQHAENLQTVVEHHEVRARADVQAGEAGRPRGRGGECLLERHAERVQVAHGVEHGQRRAGEPVAGVAPAERR